VLQVWELLLCSKKEGVEAGAVGAKHKERKRWTAKKEGIREGKMKV
jgi:hypothetical protein